MSEKIAEELVRSWFGKVQTPGLSFKSFQPREKSRRRCNQSLSGDRVLPGQLCNNENLILVVCRENVKLKNRSG